MKEHLRRLKALYGIAWDAIYDASRFYVHSQSGRSSLSDSQLKARILAKGHSIEKGLSMPSVRPLFGQDALQELCARLSEYADRGLDVGDPVYAKGRYAIAAYLDFHSRLGVRLPESLAFILPFGEVESLPERGGAIVKTADDVNQAAKGDFRQVVLSRHSIRTFSSTPVQRAMLEQAIALAQRSPSVCNRQSNRVHIVEDDAKRVRALEIQGGNRGFGQEVGCLLVVTSVLAAFRDSKERNQGFVDGGLFSMTLMFALHHLGLGCCPLNWSAGRQKDKRLRALLGIPDGELVVMLLGVGHLKAEFLVASSPRRDSSEVVNWI